MTGTPRANRPVIMTFHDVGLNRKSSPSCSIHRHNINIYKKASSCIVFNYILNYILKYITVKLLLITY